MAKEQWFDGVTIEPNVLDNLIRYHKAGLAQYVMHMGISSQYLEGQTIKALEQFKTILESKNKKTEI